MWDHDKYIDQASRHNRLIEWDNKQGQQATPSNIGKGLWKETLVNPWSNLFKNNRRMGQTSRLKQFEKKSVQLQLEFKDIDIVEGLLGYCLIKCLMGHFLGGTEWQLWLANGELIIDTTSITMARWLFGSTWCRTGPKGCREDPILHLVAPFILRIGRPLYTDMLTRIREWLMYAHIWVEVDP